MCPCHGGAYYADGSRASGPPERGLFEYAYKVDQGKLMIQVGDMPTPGAAGAKNAMASKDLIQIGSADASARRPPCAWRNIGQWFDDRLQLSGAIREAMEHPIPRKTASWFYVFGSAALTVLVLQFDGNPARVAVCPFRRRGLGQPADAQSPGALPVGSFARCTAGARTSWWRSW